MRKWGIAALACAVTAPAGALTIEYDPGGPVLDRMAQVDRLRASGEAVAIMGTCLSACTLYLGLPSVCVSPRARFGFHGPRAAIGLPLPLPEWQRITRAMAQYYPPALRSWWMEAARFRTDGHISVSGAQLIALGVRACR